jgi:UDP-galactopyranose mutase
VVSTSIRDVVRTYGETGFAKIADEPAACIAAIEQLLVERGHSADWLKRVDAMLARMSWDHTFSAMWELVESAIEQRSTRRVVRLPVRALSSSPITQISAAVPAAPTA